jgi:hypothetical protein
MNRALRATVAAAGLLLVPAPADAATKPTVKPAKKYASCAAVWKDYPHGVAQKRGVKDKVVGRSKPVTTFVIYKKVYDLNYKRLDRDKDKIICERA